MWILPIIEGFVMGVAVTHLLHYFWLQKKIDNTVVRIRRLQRTFLVSEISQIYEKILDAIREEFWFK